MGRLRNEWAARVRAATGILRFPNAMLAGTHDNPVMRW
jgi:hypothetical protein